MKFNFPYFTTHVTVFFLEKEDLKFSDSSVGERNQTNSHFRKVLLITPKIFGKNNTEALVISKTYVPLG